MKRVLVTGSMGYIGSVLLDYLKMHDVEPISCDIAFFRDAKIYNIVDDPIMINDARDVCESVIEGVDAVIHLAGISNDPLGELDASSVYDPTRLYAKNIAMLCKKYNKKFIFASSCSVYGVGGEGLLDEQSTPNPKTLYSLNKLQIEEDLAELADDRFRPTALRFATIFGMSPRIRFDVVINMLVGMAVSQNAIILNSDGLAWRPHLHILDACKAILMALRVNNINPGLLILNVGMEENNRSIIDIAKVVLEKVPGCTLKFLSESSEANEDLIRDRKVKDGKDVRTYKVSFKKIHNVLPEFKCDWTIEDGVDEMISTLKKIKFTVSDFQSSKFYRLQHLEGLHRDGFITSDLSWASK